MHETDTDQPDLNLLRVLRALTQTRSVTRAGELLGMSQPAASRAVARLRSVLGDPLLVRTSKGYVLTPCAELLAPGVSSALKAAEQLFMSATFDARRATRQFHLASTDYGALVVIAPITAAFATGAQSCAIAIRHWGSGTLAALESGELDLAFYADAVLPADFHARSLFVDSYAALVRRDHPLTRQPQLPRKAWLAALAHYPHAAIRYPSGRTEDVDDVLARLGGHGHHLSLTMPYFSTAPWMITQSDLVLTLPRRVAEPLAQAAGLALLPLPGDAPTFTYRMVWHERAHRDGGVTWLRGLIASHFDAGNKPQRGIQRR